jgi:hypothetical protein
MGWQKKKKKKAQASPVVQFANAGMLPLETDGCCLHSPQQRFYSNPTFLANSL